MWSVILKMLNVFAGWNDKPERRLDPMMEQRIDERWRPKTKNQRIVTNLETIVL